MRLTALAAVAAAALSLTACDRPAEEPQAQVEQARVEQARITLPLVAGRPGAAYFTVHGDGSPTRLVSVSSPSAERIELHDNRVENGVTRMVELTPQDATFSDRLAFEPGGKHAMLFGLDPELAPGQRVSLVFAFDRLPPVTVEAEVVASAAGHDGH